MLSSWLRPPPPIEPVPAERVSDLFHYWRFRLLSSTFIGYAAFYLVRENIPVALPLMEKDLGMHKAGLGMFLTLSGLAYGVSKMVHGLLADRTNPRVLVSVALLLSALANLAFSCSSQVVLLGAIWVANGWFQGAGFPPCARLLAYWFSPKERGLKWGIFNTSHQVGTALILVATGLLGPLWGWRSCFFVPALVALGVSFFLMERVRDTPASLGLPPVEYYTGEAPWPPPAPAPEGEVREGPRGLGSVRSAPSANQVVWERVFTNPVIWAICLGNFLVYTVRYGILHWAPTYLVQVQGLPVREAGATTAAFELAGLVGCLLAGWISDRYFASRRAPVCVACMGLCTLFVFLFWQVPPGHPWLNILCLGGIGFAVYGPQFLVGVLVADQATKRAAGSAVGLSGLFGYLSVVFSGWGLGATVDSYGWTGCFQALIACAALGALPFALCWNSSPAREDH